MNILTVAENLGKFEYEILALSPDEYGRWHAYFNIKAKDEEKARKKADRDTRAKRNR